ncbi:hypothetical protein [Arthrobacter sp. E3]|uniref:hypothetical protein n=1 Tax=Arthrobacter sp. E3 TaxID=517402 RepID=UPI001A949EB0|nr:hypothetical protein [Arthrobacter sp. E3]
MTPKSQSMVPSGENRPPERTPAAGMSVCVEASSQHPADWGRALATAISQLVEQIIDTTGIDPCREPGGLDLSLHITGLPGGKSITVTWQPNPASTEETSSQSPLTPSAD